MYQIIIVSDRAALLSNSLASNQAALNMALVEDRRWINKRKATRHFLTSSHFHSKP